MQRFSFCTKPPFFPLVRLISGSRKKPLERDTHIFVFRLCDGSVLTSIAFCLVRNRQCMSVLWLPWDEVCQLGSARIPGDVHCCSVWSGIWGTCRGDVCSMLATQWQLTRKTFIPTCLKEWRRRSQSLFVGHGLGYHPLITFSSLQLLRRPPFPFRLVNFLQIAWLMCSILDPLPKFMIP